MISDMISIMNVQEILGIIGMPNVIAIVYTKKLTSLQKHKLRL